MISFPSSWIAHAPWRKRNTGQNSALAAVAHRRVVNPINGLAALLWLCVPLYWGYALWTLILPSPTVLVEAPTEKTPTWANAIASNPWFRAQPSQASETPVNLSTQLKVQGIFKRQPGPSVALLLTTQGTEVLVEGQVSPQGYTLLSAQTMEIVVKEPSGARVVVRVNPDEKTLAQMYQSAPQSLTLGKDSYVPNEQLSLRPINPSVPKVASVRVMPANPPTIPPTIPSAPTPPPTTNNAKPLFAPPALTTNPNTRSNDEALRIISAQPRFQQLSPEQQGQIHSLLQSPQFIEAVKQEPKILHNLIESMPIEVK